MKLKKQIGVILSAVLMFSAIPSFAMATEGGAAGLPKSEVGISAGIHDGEASWAAVGDWAEKIYKVHVTTDEKGVITKVDIDGTGERPFELKNAWNEYTKNGKKHLVGKNLQAVLNMDTTNATGAHVSGNKDILARGDYGMPAKVVQMAVLNALGYKLDTEVYKTASGFTRVPLYDYRQGVKIAVNKEGKIISVEDDGTTNVQSNYVSSDNRKRIERFFDGRGYSKFIGKNAAEIKHMDINKHGIDSVAGATYNSKAARDAVLIALQSTGLPEGADPEANLKVVDGVSTQTSAVIGNNPVKVKIFVDSDNRIVKAENNDSFPQERVQERLRPNEIPDTDWDKFAKYRGFAKFNGMTVEEVKAADTTKADSIYVAGKQVELSTMAKEAILNALEKVSNESTGDELQQELLLAKEKAKSELSEYKKDEVYGERESIRFRIALNKGLNEVQNAANKEAVEEAVKKTKKALDKVKTKAELEKLKAKTYYGEADVLQDNKTPFGYKAKADVTVNSDGEIIEVNDAGIIDESNPKVKENMRYIEIFFKGNGFEKYAGVKTKELSKVDSVSEATRTSEAVKKAVGIAILKDKAVRELENYKKLTDYRANEQKKIGEVVTDLSKKIEIAADEAAVQTLLKDGKQQLDAIKTDAQLKQEEKDKEEKEKEEAAKALNDLKTKLTKALSDDLDLSKYRAEQKVEITKIATAAIKRISEAKDVEEANKIYDEAKQSIDKIETDAQLTEKEGAEHKKKEEQELTVHKNKLISDLAENMNLAAYRAEQKKEVLMLVNKAMENIINSKSKIDAQKIYDEVKTEIAKIKTNEQLNAEEEAKRKAKELYFSDTSAANKNSKTEYDFAGNKASFIVGQAEELILKLDEDFSNMFRDKKPTKENLVGSLVLEEEGKAAKELEFDKDYTAKEGSIIITIKSEYLNGLKAGKYKLKLKTLAGFASLDLIALSQEGGNQQVKPVKPEIPSNLAKAEQGNTVSKQTSNRGKSVNTGDIADIKTPLIVGGIGLAALIVLLVRRKKRSK